MEPHHRRCYMPVAPLLWRRSLSPCMHAGVLVGPGMEREGSGASEGASCRTRGPDEDRTRETAVEARMPGRLDPSSAAVDLEGDEAAGKPPSLAPRTSEGSACGRRTPPLTWTLPSEHCPSFTTRAAQTMTPDSPFYFGHFIPLDTFIVIISV